MLELGNVTKYFNNSFGFIKSVNNNEVFFHISVVKKIEKFLIHFNNEKIKDLYFWFICKDGHNGKEVVEFWSDINSIPKEYSALIPLNIAKDIFIKYNTQYSLTMNQCKELSNLLIEVFEKNFKSSSELSNYIKSEQLGYKYPNIAGIVTMSNGVDEWEFNGGFPKDIYKIVCKELNLGNKGTSARAIKFVPYNED